MRLSLRQQLAFLLVISGGIGLAVLAIATWVLNHDFVLDVAASRLEITASLKAAQVAFNLELMQTAATFLSNRVTIQEALERYNNGTDLTAGNFNLAETSLASALGNIGPLRNGLVLQAQIYAGNGSGPAGTSSVMRATGIPHQAIRLPYLNSNGQQAFLGDDDLGYPPALYPNLTVTDIAASTSFNPMASFNGEILGIRSTLVLGPRMINSSFSLISFTLPIVNNTETDRILGWATVVTDARLILEVARDSSGLGETGQTLLVGPINATNKFPPGISGNSGSARNAEVELLFPLPTSAVARHPKHVVGTPNPSFLASKYPAVERAITEDLRGIDDVGSMMRTHNEDGKHVSVGYSSPPTDLVDWIVVVEQARSEVWQPINHLRTIILACLFGVIGFMCIVSFPLAHWAVLPIMKLRAATEQTIAPPGRSYSDSKPSSYYSKDLSSCASRTEKGLHRPSSKWTGGIFAAIFRKFSMKKQAARSIQPRDEDHPRIPGKVPQRNTWITDEMSDLITTFNDMSDELLAQYTKLEDRVRQRTIELEYSKKAAEAANESKTRFVANVSHELRTPLNGILGLAAVCMAENDPNRVKGSLMIIEKSGNLLLRTLNDLLTFSTNQLGHQVLTLDEKDFAIRDIETQTLAIFGQQSKERHVHLRFIFEETPGDVYGTGKLRDLRLYGDVHRILQIVINLVGNSLKFTPEEGSVILRVRCLKEKPAVRRVTPGAPATRQQTPASPGPGTACFINPREVEQGHGLAHEDGRSLPAGTDVFIELEVEDTGPGIEPEMQARIFEPFVQADAGLDRRHNGTGLGLSISTQLVSLMDGTIRLSSTLGKGSTFTAKLPLRIVFGTSGDTPRSSMDLSRTVTGMFSPSTSSPATPSSPEVVHADAVPGANSSTAKTDPSSPANTPPLANPSSQFAAAHRPVITSPATSPSSTSSSLQSPDFTQLRILVAEDNKVNQEVIQRMLRLEKIQHITIASDGRIALGHIISSHATPDHPPFDLILMDIQMPNMDGLQATRKIRAEGFKNPIVALTAFAEQSNVEECFGAGMDFFLAKPVKRAKLKDVLVQCRSKKRIDGLVEEGDGGGKVDYCTNKESA
ncbi:unnamed protein product [Zymoseptoria tritici ST99CH_1A5]|uniref:histidine kinase n=1 Tax=Zymoseptoria tritici ST99CH_1A5 TaxID=1276529 RepID=A0A1Y6LXL3_ZYMTR|nr:unnamed protein product [Zymoseptoria tritici ST99CH_1A5]